MAAFYSSTSYHEPIWHQITTATTATTSATTVCICDDQIHYSARNYEPFYIEPLPKCETDSEIQMARMAVFGVDPLRLEVVRRPTCVGIGRSYRHRPRSKLRYWRSLNEKRMAWGIS